MTIAITFFSKNEIELVSDQYRYVLNDDVVKEVLSHKPEIENFTEWYARLHRTRRDLLGATWDKEKKLLKLFYQDKATELPEDELKTLKIPTVLNFRKKVVSPKLDSAAVVSATENEFTVETFDAEAVRKEVKEKLTEFEEAKK